MYAHWLTHFKPVLYFIAGHSFNTYAEFSEKNNISYTLIRTCTCAYQEVRNVSFSENFAYGLNE